MKSNRRQKCVLCGRVIKKSTIMQKIEGVSYVVHRYQCAVILKRLHSVYGNEFCLELKKQ